MRLVSLYTQIKKWTVAGLFIAMFIHVIKVNAGTPSALSSMLSGNYAHLSAGVLYSRPLTVSNYLMRDDMLGKSYTASPLAYNFGGELAVSTGRMLYAFGAYNSISKGTSTRGNAKFGLNGAYLRAGYILRSRNMRMCYLYGGIGVAQHFLRINNSADSGLLYPDTRNTVSPGVFKTYQLGCALTDVGFAFKRVLIPVGREDGEEKMFGGVLVGLEAGCMMAFSGNAWKVDHYNISGIPVPHALYTPYLRITIGPGGSNAW